MLACQVAYTLYRTPTKIARIRSADYYGSARTCSAKAALPVDIWISPEQLVTDYIERLIRYPGALQVLDFADGKVRLVGVRALRGGLLVGQKLRALREHIPNTDARVAAIYRDGQEHHPQGRHGHRARRRGVLHRRARGHPPGDERDAQGGGSGAPRGDRGRRQHRLSAGASAREAAIRSS